MFEQYTEASKAVLVEAQDIAVELGSGYISVGHLLYGCAEVASTAARTPSGSTTTASGQPSRQPSDPGH